MPDSMLRIAEDFDLGKLIGHEGIYPVGVLITSEPDNTKNLLVVQKFFENNRSTLCEIKDSITLNIGHYTTSDMAMSTVTIEPSLAKILSDLNIHLSISSYRTSED